jgi:hypothetical protein
MSRASGAFGKKPEPKKPTKPARNKPIGTGSNGGITKPVGKKPEPKKPTPAKSKPIGTGSNGGVTKPNGKVSTEKQGPPVPKTVAQMGRYAQGSDQQGGYPMPQLRSPAIGAPIHAKPAAFGSATKLQGGTLSAQPSVYAPQVGQAPKPNTPQPAAQPITMSPQYGGNDEPGRMGQNEGGYQMPQQAPATPAGGPDANGIDMERRRAFLDADNSLDGLKAVKDLLNRRKLSISVEN